MCQYRYYYYAGCRHQRTVLVNYCANATPVATARLPQQSQHPPRPPSTAGNSDPFDDDEGSASSIPDLTSNSTAPSSSPTTTTSDSHTSHRQYTLPSIFEPTSDVASLHLQRPVRRHSDPLIIDMATLPTFARSNWREPFQLIVEAAKNTPSAETSRLDAYGHECAIPDASARPPTDAIPEQSSSKQQSVDRQDTKQTPNAAPQSNPSPQHRYTARDYAEMFKELVEARQELERLKREGDYLQRSRDANESAYSKNPSSPVTQGHRDIPLQAIDPNLSPAALLQREHERMQLQQACVLDMAMPDAPTTPPSSLDFPELYTAEHVLQPSSLKSNAVRKPSYASMVTHVGVQTEDKNNITREEENGNSVSQSATTADAADQENTSASPTQTPGPASRIWRVANDGTCDQDTQLNLKSNTPVKAPPRFAQPTMAFSRRADETIRKSINNNTSGTPPEGKSPSLCSSAQKQQKRKSLPGDWLSGSPSQAAKHCQVPAHPSIGSHASEQIVAAQEANPRKKTGTYRSPTKAATQRTIATIGQETTPPYSPRLQRNVVKADVSPTLVRDTATITSDDASSASLETTIQVELSDRRMSELQPRSKDSIKLPAPRRSTIGADLPHSRQLPANTSIAELLSQQARAAGLPMVANLTTQRRGSHGHLLIPIKAKLDRIGILRDGPHVSNVRGTSDLFSPSSRTNQSDPFSPPQSRTMYDIQEATFEASKGDDKERREFDAVPRNKKVVVPPHVRAALKDAAAQRATTSSATSRQTTDAPPSLRATAQEFKPMLQQVQQPVHQQTTAQHQGAPLLRGAFSSNSTLPHTYAAAVKLQPKPTRAPDDSPPAFIDGFPTTEEATRFYDEDEWLNMTPDMRRAILERRTHIRGAPGPYHQSHSQGAGPVHGQYAGMQSLSTTCPDVFGSSPQESHMGQVQLPRVHPLGQPVHWAAKSGIDLQTPLAPGRPAMPMLPPPLMAPRPPPVGFNSTQFALPRTPAQQPRSWTIGSDQVRRVYGWKGGDGREIKFVGHGPDAERDPNSGIRFNYQRRVASNGRGPRLVGAVNEDGSPEAPLAPRSRHHWAQLAGHMRQPCDNMEIVDAVEQMPMPGNEPLYGYCGNCAISSH
ncbi:hypothetical protein CB0940_12034 [Cercospora beticola]|uniref:Uncharacterized protein n=1 Tax=Cercospora beticola TaxID=122368 RepID=A0A2G5IE97_CERBT|nr:hypothetical protein CB0940_12034 [Cercospora beticola]PIB03131.1 hypothetical protein CB0940_12034 [Cercospora beticola]WPB04418.1 hypothetical protein RHO25_009064 [Cercospora beticola]CAK1356751.1 unnamed protein product [Cercospora beticola]